MKSSLLSKALAVTALGVATTLSVPAFAVGSGLPFQVQEGVVVPDTPAHIVTADSISASYSAMVSSTGTPGAFTESGYVTLSAFNLGALTASSFLNSPEPVGYKLYGLFSFSGTTSLDGTTIVQTPTNPASLSLFLDRNSNSTFTLPATGSGSVAVANTGDDSLLGTASNLTSAEGHIFAGLANGDFEGVFSDWTLTALGATYFFDPSPFYMIIDLNGNTTTITPAASLGPFTSTTEGVANIFLTNVPEPATLALFGIGLLGLGTATSRRNKK